MRKVEGTATDRGVCKVGGCDLMSRMIAWHCKYTAQPLHCRRPIRRSCQRWSSLNSDCHLLLIQVEVAIAIAGRLLTLAMIFFLLLRPL